MIGPDKYLNFQTELFTFVIDKVKQSLANGIQLGGGTGGTITGSTIQNNHIGTDATNTLDLGNTGYGILITTPETVTNNQIGGTGLGQGNSIAFLRFW